jgi:hypothetical protein
MRVQLAVGPHNPRFGCANLSAHMDGLANAAQRAGLGVVLKVMPRMGCIMTAPREAWCRLAGKASL